MILGSAPVPYISVWVLIPSILGGREVIADALVSGTPGIRIGGDDGSLPPQATVNRSTVANISSRVALSFTRSYYLKYLRNG